MIWYGLDVVSIPEGQTGEGIYSVLDPCGVVWAVRRKKQRTKLRSKVVEGCEVFCLSKYGMGKEEEVFEMAEGWMLYVEHGV